MPSLLCLEASPTDFRGDEIFCGIGIITRRLESAGRSFFQAYEKIASESGTDANETKDKRSTNSSYKEDGADSLSDDEDEKWGAKHKEDNKKGKTGAPGAPTKLKKLIEGPNLYSILGVQDNCNTDTIKKAYRRLALEFHPDKKNSKSNAQTDSGSSPSSCNDEEQSSKGNKSPSASDTRKPPQLNKCFDKYTDEEMFLLIQDAYEALSDPAFRRQYDSALPFDEGIPSSSEVKPNNPQTFFNAFLPVFKRNARWSSKKPVPNLGQLESNMKDVHRFYSFWWSFDSTRDFSVNDEYDVADAECREERRWMERQNMKIRRKFIKEEKNRLNKLTDLAFSLDPRVIAEKESQRKRKEEVKGAKRREAQEKLEQQRAEETKKREDRIAHDQAIADIHKKKTEERQKIKATLKKNRQRLRQVCKLSIDANVLDPDVLQEICLSLESDALDHIATYLESFLEDSSAPTRIAAELISQVETQTKKLDGPSFSFDSSQINGSEKTELPDTNKVQEIAPNVSSWTANELSILAKGIQKYPGGTARRWQLIANMIGTKSMKAVIQKTKELSDGNTLKSMGPLLSKDAYQEYNKGTVAHRDIPNVIPTIDMENISDVAKENVHSSITTNNYSFKSETNDQQTPIVWTEEQQKCFENALKANSGKLSTKDDWIAIAHDVPGKTAKECLARFKEIRNAIQATGKSC